MCLYNTTKEKKMINTTLISRLLVIDQVISSALEHFPAQKEALRLHIDALINQHVDDHSDDVEAQLMARLENNRISNIYSQLKEGNKNA
jgi:hypothetical protein